MATPDEIREELKKQAGQRVNPLLKGLSMLTGGIAGEFTGTNEQIRQQRQAKRALMEENLSALQEERLMSRLKAQQDEMLKRQLEIEEANRLAATRARVAQARGEANVLAGRDPMGPLEPAEQAGMEIARANIAKAEADRIRALEAARPEMTGYLAAQGVQTGEPDIETLQFLTAQQKTKEAMQKEAERKKSGYLQFNIPGVGTVGGSPEQIKAFRDDPYIGPMLSKLGTEDSPFTSSVGLDMETSTPTIRLGFKSGVTPEQQAEITGRFAKAFAGQSEFAQQSMGAAATPKPLPKGPPAKEGSPIVGRGTGEARSAAAESLAREIQPGAWPAVGEVKPDVRGVYYTGTKDGLTSGITQTGAYDIPESVTQEMEKYPMSTEARMNILKNYIRRIKPEAQFGTPEVQFPR